MGKRPLRGVDGEVRIGGLADRDGETKMCCHWITARILTIVTTEGRQSIFNMKTYRVKQLTRQYNGHTHFKYIVQPTEKNILIARNQLAEWREWCWQTWGPGRELLWSITATPHAVWSWDSEHGNRRIYLKSDAELVLFELKF